MSNVTITAKYFIPQPHMAWVRANKRFEPGIGEGLYGHVLITIDGRKFSLDNLIWNYMFAFADALRQLDRGEDAEVSNDDNPGWLIMQRQGEKVAVSWSDYLNPNYPNSQNERFQGDRAHAAASASIQYVEFKHGIAAMLGDFARFLDETIPNDPLAQRFQRELSS